MSKGGFGVWINLERYRFKKKEYGRKGEKSESSRDLYIWVLLEGNCKITNNFTKRQDVVDDFKNNKRR